MEIFKIDKNELEKYGEVTDVINYELSEVVDESIQLYETAIICGRAVVILFI